MDVIFNKLTGSELKKIWETSGLDAAEFAKELTISRSTLYNHFKEEVIPEDVETRLNGNPELYKYRKMLKMRVGDEMEDGGGAFRDLLTALKDTVKIANAALESNNKQLSIIEKDHIIYQQLITQGMKDGILKFVHPVKKAG